MKKILLIANYITFLTEKGNSRFGYILDMLKKEDVAIELITSNFFHTQKKHREKTQEELSEELGYKVTLIDEPGYKKNVSLKRFYSHYKFAQNVKKYLKNIETPDIIYCSVPSLDIATVVAKYAEQNNIKFIVDVQDLWPEAYKMVFKIPIVSDIIFYPMKKQADYIYSKADDIIAVSETYIERAACVNKKSGKRKSVFLGTDLEVFDNYRKNHYIEFNDNDIRIVYIGTLGNSYDIKCVIDSLKILDDKGIKNILFVVMGSGPMQEEFEAYAKEKGVKCDFVGRMNYEEMVGKLCSCNIAVNPIRKGSAGSIINKVGDYAAAGLPVVNTQESKEYRKLVEDYKIGFNVENGNSVELAEKIEKLYYDINLRKEMGANNRKLAEEKFDRKITYKEIIDLLKEEVK